LIICTGKNTKKIDQFVLEDKTYTGTILIGKTTPSYDLETEYNQEFSIEHINDSLLEEVRLSFLGEQDQIPPIFSAKQVDGKRAYDLARAGKDVVLKANKINVSLFEIETSRFPEIDFKITCSKGTYIRSIANDFGQRLNAGAALIALRRTASGSFLIENAKAVDDWITTIHNS
jgi:tRNA pseudouridine55 synthase